MYRDPKNKVIVTLYNYSCPEKMRKEAKPHGENPPSRKDKAQNLNNMSSIGIYLHLNEMNKLLLVKYLTKNLVDSVIMH